MQFGGPSAFIFGRSVYHPPGSITVEWECCSDIFCILVGCLSVYLRPEIGSKGIILRLAEAVAQVGHKLIVQFRNISIELEYSLLFINYRKIPQNTILICNVYLYIHIHLSRLYVRVLINIYVPYSKDMQFILPREDGESVIQAEDCLRSATTIRMKYISVRGDICNSSALERRRRRPAARMSPERPSGSEARHERLQYPNDIVLFILPSLKYSHSSPILLAYAQIGTKHLERSRRMGNAGTTARL